MVKLNSKKRKYVRSTTKKLVGLTPGEIDLGGKKRKKGNFLLGKIPLD